MPNSNAPIQRASSTCVTSASTALATRMANTLPATNCASRESLRSASLAFRRANRPAGGDAAAAGSPAPTGTAGGAWVAGDGKAIRLV